MNNKKHIDRIFQEKLKNFEATPDDAAWDAIHDRLHKKERKRRVIPIWWLTTGVAALLALFLAIGGVFNPKSTLDSPTNSVVETETKQNAESQASEPVKDSSLLAPFNKARATSITGTGQTEDHSNTNLLEKTHTPKDKTKPQIAHGSSNSDSVRSKTEAVAKSTPNLPLLDLTPNHPDVDTNQPLANPVKNTDVLTLHTNQDATEPTVNMKEPKVEIRETKEPIEEAIAKALQTNEEEKERQLNRWSISPSVAPVYFNSMGKGSSIDQQFVNSGKATDVSMSYGINGSYAITDKIKIRAGINKVDLGYQTGDVVAFRDAQSFNATMDHSQLRNINFTSIASRDQYMSSPNNNLEAAPQFVVASVKGTLEQQFGYIEVPLEVEYSLINTKFGLNLIGGFSTLFLNNNEIYSVLESRRTLVGEANNMNSTSYSANLGLGLNYHISRTLKLNVEPMFKYQINTFTNTSGDFRPYFIGVYSGFSFKF